MLIATDSVSVSGYWPMQAYLDSALTAIWLQAYHERHVVTVQQLLAVITVSGLVAGAGISSECDGCWLMQTYCSSPVIVDFHHAMTVGCCNVMTVGCCRHIVTVYLSPGIGARRGSTCKANVVSRSLPLCYQTS